MFARINIFNIIRDHLKTLKHLENPDSKFIYWKDFLLFFIFPALVAIVLVYKNYTFIDSLSNLITGISILGGFLFNLLAIIYSQIDKIKQDIYDSKDSTLLSLKQKFVTEIHSNISFCIVLSIGLILTLLLMEVELPSKLYPNILHKLLIWLNYFLLILFTLTMLMIINRVYILLKKDAEQN